MAGWIGNEVIFTCLVVLIFPADLIFGGAAGEAVFHVCQRREGTATF